MPDTPIYKMARCEVQTHFLEQEVAGTIPNIGLSCWRCPRPFKSQLKWFLVKTS